MAAQTACIIRGGMAGVGLRWTLSQQNQPVHAWDVRLKQHVFGDLLRRQATAELRVGS